jgi:hypothetical protein
MRNAGRRYALHKLGFYLPALGGAAFGALSGNVLSPEDRKGQGTLTGALLGGLGGALGSKVSPVAGTALGSLAGLGVSQAFINKNKADTAEDPYRYQAQ